MSVKLTYTLSVHRGQVRNMATLKDSKYFVYYSDRNITHLGYKI